MVWRMQLEQTRPSPNLDVEDVLVLHETNLGFQNGSAKSKHTACRSLALEDTRLAQREHELLQSKKGVKGHYWGTQKIPVPLVHAGDCLWKSEKIRPAKWSLCQAASYLTANAWDAFAVQLHRPSWRQDIVSNSIISKTW